MDWGRSSSLMLHRSLIWTSVNKQNMEMCQSAAYIICDPLLENRTYEAKSNFEKGSKINFVSNMASRSTVSLQPFPSK